MIYTIYPCFQGAKWYGGKTIEGQNDTDYLMILYHFASWIHFTPISICPLSFCHQQWHSPSSWNIKMSTIYPCIPILNRDLIYPLWTILRISGTPPSSFCPLEIVSWFTLFTHIPYHFAPCIHFAHISFCPLEMVLWLTLFTHVPYHFATALDFVFIVNKKPFTTKAYDRRTSGDWHLW